jgi:hypothetical protein
MKLYNANWNLRTGIAYMLQAIDYIIYFVDYLMAILLASLYTAEWTGDRWTRIWKEGSRGLVEVISRHFPGETEENHEIAFRIVNVPAEIRAKHFLNTNQERYWCANPFGSPPVTIESFHL